MRRLRLFPVKHRLNGRVGNIEPLGYLSGTQTLVSEGLDDDLGFGFPFDRYGLKQNYALQKSPRFVYLFVFFYF